MEAEETTEKSMGGHRPLPQVDMPLLRDQRRAARNRNVILAAGLGVLAVGGVAAAIFLPGGEGEAGGGDEAPPEAAAAPSGALPDGGAVAEAAQDAGVGPVVDETAPRSLGAVSRVVHGFGQSRGFRDALARAGFELDEAQALEEALDGVLDFRRCRPTDEMIVERDTNGMLLLFEYHGGSATHYYQATRDDQGELRGEKVEIPVEKVRVARGGTVRTSIGDALDGLGLGRTLVGTFVSVWEGKVNFSRDTRQGDVFKIIVDEERIEGEFLRYGRVHAVEYVGQRTGELRAFWFEPRGGQPDFYDEDGRSIHGGWLRTPLRYDHISSRYDPRRMHPILRRIVPHNGVDYAAGTGTPVWAAAAGEVTWAGMKGANGNLVSIRHQGGYLSHYAHLHRIERGIERGTEVDQRQVIGYVGSTGRSTGPHLHFGLKKHGRFVDPIEEMNGPGRMMPSGNLGRYRQVVRRLTRELGQIETGSSGPAPAAGDTGDTGEEPQPDEQNVPMD